MYYPKPKLSPIDIFARVALALVIVSVFIFGCISMFSSNGSKTAQRQSGPAYTAEDTLIALKRVMHETVELYLKENLNDAKSYESVSWGDPVKSLGGSYMIRHRYRAKNGFGAYVISNQFFIVGASGNVESVYESD